MYNISIIIPTIDSLPTLPLLIKKILPHLKDKDELIFLDTESLDGTLEFLEQLHFANKRIVTVRRGTFSHSATRMMGAELAQGDIVVFLTDDVLPVTDDFLEQLVRPVEQGAVVASSGIAQIDPQTGDPLRARRYNGWWRGRPEQVGPISTEQWGLLTPQQRYDVCRLDDCAACYDREVLLKVRFPEVPYGEDIAIAKRLLLAGYRIGITPHARFYHWHDITFSYFLKRMCIDQVMLNELFGLILVGNAAKLLHLMGAQAVLYTCLGLFGRGVDRRLHWIRFSWKYILADNLGKYIGSMRGRAAWWNLAGRLRYRLKQDILASIQRDSIGKQTVAQKIPYGQNSAA